MSAIIVFTKVLLLLLLLLNCCYCILVSGAILKRLLYFPFQNTVRFSILNLQATAEANSIEDADVT